MTASDQTNLLIKHKFTNLKRQNQKTKSSLYKFRAVKTLNLTKFSQHHLSQTDKFTN
ncbi:hypothetical protein [Campylobacter concisus]|uniref:hypothetical protein n=1 Tax=Campylobacter concisus TaxID=199 RepID=UPI0015E1A340|nr:hypothetical protein [Campylobacter concisus]